MTDLFGFLIFATLFAFFVGMVKPSLFSRWIKEPTRKKVGLVLGGLLFLFFIAFSAVTPSKTITESVASNTETQQLPSPTPNTPQKPTQEVEKLINYKLVYTVTDKRYDGGNNYYILIDPISLTNDSFKTDIKKLVNKLVKDHGNKNSFEFYDDKPTLEVSYKQYGNLSLGRVRTDEENKMMARHLVASYDGELETDVYKNTLRFFLATFKDDPDVGKYVETLEYNPQ